MFDIVQGMNAWVSALHLIRPHSYEGLVVVAALTECRWLTSVASDKKSQLEVLGTIWQQILDLNQAQARSFSPPLTYKEVMQEIKAKVAEKGWLEHRICLGDILEPTSSENQTNIAVEVEALRTKVNNLEQGTPGEVKSKSKKKKKDKKTKPKLSQTELLKRLNDNLGQTCTMYNQVYIIEFSVFSSL